MIRALFRDTMVYGASAIISRGLSIVIVPVFTRILAPGEYGALDMIMVVGVLMALIVPLEINQAMARFYGDADSVAEKRRLASAALWFTVGGYAVATMIGLAAARPIAKWLLGGAGMVDELRLGFAYIAATGLFYLAQTVLRFEFRSKAYAVVSIVYSFASLLLAVLLGLGLEMGLMGVLWGQLIGAAVAAALGLYLARDRFAPRFDRPLLGQLLGFSFPLVLSGLGTFFTLNSNRLLLNDIEGLSAVGLFGLASRVAGVVALLVIGLQTALTPLIYVHYREPGTPRMLGKLAEEFLALALFCCLLLGLFSWEILALLVEPRYLAAAPLVMFLAPATLLGQCYVFFPGIAITKRTRLQLYIFLATAIATVTVNWLLIHAAGLVGAAWATLLSSVLFVGLWVAVSQRLYRLELRWLRLGFLSALFVIAAISGFWLQASGYSLAWTVAGKTISALLFLCGAMISGLLHPAGLIAILRRPDTGMESERTEPPAPDHPPA